MTDTYQSLLAAAEEYELHTRDLMDAYSTVFRFMFGKRPGQGVTDMPCKDKYRIIAWYMQIAAKRMKRESLERIESEGR